MKGISLKFESKKLCRLVKGKIKDGRFKESKKVNYLIGKTEPAILERPGLWFLFSWWLGAKLRPFFIFYGGKCIPVEIKLPEDKQELAKLKYATPQSLGDIDDQKALSTAMRLQGMTTMKEIIMFVMCFALGFFVSYFLITSGAFGAF